MRIGIGIGEIANQPATIDSLVAQAKRAEADGFHSGWLANIFGVDACMGAALCGRETTRLELGTAVVPTYPRHPHAMAQLALSAQAACNGRFALGIGLSHAMVIETMFGMSWAKPYSHMREYLAVLAPLLRDGSVSFQGDEFRVNAQVRVAGARSCPLLVAALAPKMLALAGRETDGTITWMTGPKTIRDNTAPRLQDAAAKAGRKAPRIVVGLPIAVTADVPGARESAARQFQIYGMLPSYRRMLDAEGAEGPADVAIIGSEAQVRDQLGALATAGTTDLLWAPFPIEADPDAIERTRAVLVSLARQTA